MGRRVYTHKGEFVWKYCFGEQPSEQNRIYTDLGIGKYHEYDDRDRLALSRKDIEKLANMVKPMRPLLAEFLNTEHRILHPIGKTKVIGISCGDNESLMAKFKKRNADILFHLMCYHYVMAGRKFFRQHKASRVMNLYGEF